MPLIRRPLRLRPAPEKPPEHPKIAALKSKLAAHPEVVRLLSAIEHLLNSV
jgi:hypothetical protein